MPLPYTTCRKWQVRGVRASATLLRLLPRRKPENN
nr:MAG TPA: hypothetical protein [Caudoviricetes sp.]